MALSASPRTVSQARRFRIVTRNVSKTCNFTRAALEASAQYSTATTARLNAWEFCEHVRHRCSSRGSEALASVSFLQIQGEKPRRDLILDFRIEPISRL